VNLITTLAPVLPVRRTTQSPLDGHGAARDVLLAAVRSGLPSLIGVLSADATTRRLVRVSPTWTSVCIGTTTGRQGRLRTARHSYREFAEQLTTDEIPTADGGGVWHPATVRAVIYTQAANGSAMDPQYRENV
jgi:hypothetical protein